MLITEKVRVSLIVLWVTGWKKLVLRTERKLKNNKFTGFLSLYLLHPIILTVNVMYLNMNCQNSEENMKYWRCHTKHKLKKEMICQKR